MLQQDPPKVNGKIVPLPIPTTKPTYRTVLRQNIPDTLKAVPRWVVWAARLEGSKWKKPPFSPASGVAIHAGKPLEAQLGTFDQAVKALETGIRVKGDLRLFDGIGLYPPEGMVGIDADRCLDADGGITVPEIRAWVDSAVSYVERSPTVTGGGSIGGIRCFAMGRKPGPASQRLIGGISYELYAGGMPKYLTVTGHNLNDRPVVPDQDGINAFYRLLEGQAPPSSPPPVSVLPGVVTDTQILESMFRTARNGSRLESLYRQGTLGGDHSAEDFELMEALAYYAGDPRRTEDLFRASALYRPEGKSKSYVSRSIAKVFERKASFFDWHPEKSDEVIKSGVSGVSGVSRTDKSNKNSIKESKEVRHAEKSYGVSGVSAFEMDSDGAMKSGVPGVPGVPAHEMGAKEKRRQIISKMNRQYAAVILGGKFRIMREYWDPVSKHMDIAFMGPQDFHGFHANKLLWLGQDEKPISHSKLWFTSKDRREYEGIVLAPPTKQASAPIPTTFYNLWRGFGVKPKRGKWDIFEEHILMNICNGNTDHFRWVMAWLARIVQDPGGERPGTAIVLMGEKGNGKSTFAEMFRPIFGRHYIALSNQRHVTGNFNHHLKDKVFVFGDEAFWGGSKNDEGVLKALITEPTIPIEAKGQDLIELSNYINLVMATNNEWGIPASMDERRFFVTKVSNRNKQDAKFFGPLKAQMERGGGIEAMLYDLLEHDDPEINLRHAPKTEALFSQIECSMNPVQKWWYQRLSDGVNIEDETGNWYESVRTKTVYNDYMAFAENLKLRNSAITPKQFGRRLRDLAPSIQRVQQTFGNREREYHFKSLEEHRKEFRDKINFDVDW